MHSDITVDGRTSTDIFEQARKMAPHYLTEWNVSNVNDSAVILLRIFSKLFEDIIKRMDEVPEKNFIAFLDMLGMGLYPSQPSKVPLTFTVSQGATAAIHIKEQTRVAADATQTRPEMVFEVGTGNGFLATPSLFKKIISVDPRTDRIFEHQQSLEMGESIELFNDKNDLQEHILYIGHDDLFTLTGEAKIDLFITSPGLDIPSVKWEYYGEKIEVKDREEVKTDGWHRLEFNNSNTLKNRSRNIPAKTPVIDIRGISSIFSERLGEHGILTVEQLLKITPEELARKLETNVSRAKNILDAAEKGQMDKGTTDSAVALISGTYANAKTNVNTGTSTSIKPNTKTSTVTYHIVLHKDFPGEIKEYEINGITSRWIRCNTGSIDEVKTKLLIDSMMISVGPGVDGGTNPDMVFFNEVPLDVPGMSETNPLYPYGTIPITYSTFYLASSDAFSKKWLEVSLSFDIMSHDQNDGTIKGPSPRLSWEYWNGQGWIHIPGINGLTHNFTTQGVQTVTFLCPGDMDRTEVNGQENFWIRIRIVDGDYGKIKFVEKASATADENSGNTTEKSALIKNETDDGDSNGVNRGPWEISYEDIKAPKFKNILISYKEQQEKRGRLPKHIIKYNNLEYCEVLSGDRPASPFMFFDSISDRTQSLYLGFDRQLKSGPITIFFSIKEREYPETFHPKFVWEYWNNAISTDWTKLEVTDETENLTKRGILRLIAPADISSSNIFGDELFWIRARVVSEEFTVQCQQVTSTTPITPPQIQSQRNREPCEETITFDLSVPSLEIHPPVLSNIILNTTWANQAETVKNEILGSSDGTPGQQFLCSKHPVFREEIWVNELSSLSAGERNDLTRDELSSVTDIKDDDGNTVEFWVKWTRVDDFLSSHADDRHYVLEAAMGVVVFGDGINGRLPPIESDNIKVNYQTGGGSAGNVETGAISALKSSIPFIDGVTNPELSDGGSDMETMDQLVVRAPQQLKNRGRAVTEEDFEWIACEASRKVSRANCIPNLDNNYSFNPGWITLIIVPHSNEDKPELSAGLKDIVRTYVEKRCAGCLYTLDRITINGPIYLAVSISAKLVTSSADVIPSVEAIVYRDIQKFLHPLTGGYTANGWEFGKLPCLSDFYRLLEEMDGVDHVENLSMEIGEATYGQNVVVTPQSEFYPRLKPYNLVCSGNHRIDITI